MNFIGFCVSGCVEWGIYWMIFMKKYIFHHQDMAQVAGDEEKVAELKSQLDELEERAEELDRRRTNNISSIR